MTRNFRCRYYRFLLMIKLGSVNKFVLPELLVIVLILSVLEIFGIELHFMRLGVWAVTFTYIAFQFISPLYYVIKNGKLAKYFNKYG